MKPAAATPLLKRLDLAAKKLKPGTAMYDLKNAIKLGEQALGEAHTILVNFNRIKEEKARRDAEKSAKRGT